jgi:hypothetical protein
MAAPLSKKTFKLELEFTVSMEELGEKHLTPNLPSEALPYLKQLQESLVENEPALLQQIMTQIAAKLQQYTDHLAAQNNLALLKQIDATLEVDDCTWFNPSDHDFSELTRPVRISAMKTELESCTLDERVQDPQGKVYWEAAWNDLWMQSQLVRLAGKYPAPATSHMINAHQASGHYFSVRYLTEQRDGIHCEALCSCGRTITSEAEDESRALETAWADYQKHLEVSNLAMVELHPSEILSGKN